ncbi:SubName: Full=Uncharacterized protein {ECO:0000313/EMBL:KIM29612.1} [Serendipita indica DSM 11827]|nr:SubName: Full=Uncharacterized protein {ECO:0000313/EMBL:KIM29612.1} [Serendipita indica DSM 11827]
MGKKDKAKSKTKGNAASDENARAAGGDVIMNGVEPGGVAAGSAWRSSHIDGFGAKGWGESPVDEQKNLHWLPDPNTSDWDTPVPDISAWLGTTGEEIPGLMGSGAKRHPSAAVRMSLANSANQRDVPPDVAALLASMQAGPMGSPPRAPTELSVHRSSAAYSSNPLRSAGPTRANSVSGGHTSTYSALPASANLQQTRFFQRPSQPLSTIHSERSVHTLMNTLAADEAAAAAAAASQAGWSHTHEGLAPLHEEMSYLPEGHISTEIIGGGGPGNAEYISFQQSGGEALIPADLALFKSPRPAKERLRWDLNSDQDESVSSLLNWIDVMSADLATLALFQYTETKSRGALISNASYRPAHTPDEPAFDWITFEQARGTLDPTFQESIAKYDPNTQFIVYVFLLSPSGNSLAIWRRKLPIPPEVTDAFADKLAETNEIVRRKPCIVAVEELPHRAKTPKSTVKMSSSRQAGTQSATVPTFAAAGQSVRSRTTSVPTPAKNTITRSSSTLKKDPPEKEKKRSTWSKIFGGRK